MFVQLYLCCFYFYNFEAKTPKKNADLTDYIYCKTRNVRGY